MLHKHLFLLFLLVGCVTGMAACTTAEVLAPPPTRTPAAEYAQLVEPVIIKRSSASNPSGRTEDPASQAAIRTDATPVPESPSASEICVTVTVEFGLRVRGGAGTQFANLAVLEDGSQHPFLETNGAGTWYRIDRPDIGPNTWVSADFSRQEPCRN